jgi:hypothetical protein
VKTPTCELNFYCKAESNEKTQPYYWLVIDHITRTRQKIDQQKRKSRILKERTTRNKQKNKILQRACILLTESQLYHRQNMTSNCIHKLQRQNHKFWTDQLTICSLAPNVPIEWKDEKEIRWANLTNQWATHLNLHLIDLPTLPPFIENSDNYNT